MSLADALVEVGLPPDGAAVAAALVPAMFYLGLLAGGMGVGVWLERKISARIQDRLGPTRVGGAFGWLQSVADLIKLLAKEDLIPDAADKLLFRVAPYISLMAVYTAFLAVPLAPGWAGQILDTAVFFVLAVLGLGVFGVILAGYASGSKWSLFGAIREAAQVVSYEIPLAVCVVVPVFLAGSMSLETIAQRQAGWGTEWFLVRDPFTFGLFFIYFTCALASTNRAPFDLAEAESELVAGFHTEYSGFRWGVFFIAEYGAMTLVCLVGAILFLGGWNGPIPIFHLLGWVDGPVALGWLASVAGAVNLLLKTLMLVIVMMVVRWTLPRLRIDQVITTCLKYCLPLALVGLTGAIAWRALALPTVADLTPNMTVTERMETERSEMERMETGPGAARTGTDRTRGDGLPSASTLLAGQDAEPFTPPASVPGLDGRRGDAMPEDAVVTDATSAMAQGETP